MTTFALVHGGWHGAWCWERLTPFLQQAGHDVVTMDLPSEDGTASFDAYADVVWGSLEGRGDDVVLVGHSLADTRCPWWPRVDPCAIWCTCAPWFRTSAAACSISWATKSRC